MSSDPTKPKGQKIFPGTELCREYQGDASCDACGAECLKPPGLCDDCFEDWLDSPERELYMDGLASLQAARQLYLTRLQG